jgi:lipid A 3-O-deacylase
MGWDNQVANELCLDVSYSRIWSTIQPGPGSFQLGITSHVTMELGNVYTYAAGGVMLRFGGNLEACTTPPNIRPGFPGVPYFRSSLELNWYFFAGYESRLVFRDIFLDGNTFSDSHSVDKERLVGNHQFGFSMHKSSWRVALSTMSRTKEFTTQDELTRYGVLNVSFIF